PRWLLPYEVRYRPAGTRSGCCSSPSFVRPRQSGDSPQERSRAPAAVGPPPPHHAEPAIVNSGGCHGRAANRRANTSGSGSGTSRTGRPHHRATAICGVQNGTPPLDLAATATTSRSGGIRATSPPQPVGGVVPSRCEHDLVPPRLCADTSGDQAPPVQCAKGGEVAAGVFLAAV